MLPNQKLASFLHKLFANLLIHDKLTIRGLCYAENDRFKLNIHVTDIFTPCVKLWTALHKNMSE